MSRKHTTVNGRFAPGATREGQLVGFLQIGSVKIAREVRSALFCDGVDASPKVLDKSARSEFTSQSAANILNADIETIMFSDCRRLRWIIFSEILQQPIVKQNHPLAGAAHQRLFKVGKEIHQDKHILVRFHLTSNHAEQTISSSHSTGVSNDCSAGQVVRDANETDPEGSRVHRAVVRTNRMTRNNAEAEKRTDTVRVPIRPAPRPSARGQRTQDGDWLTYDPKNALASARSDFVLNLEACR